MIEDLKNVEMDVSTHFSLERRGERIGGVLVFGGGRVV